MKRWNPVSFVVVTLAAALAIGLVDRSVVAQPVPQGGLRFVTHNSEMTGSGTSTSALGLKTTCANNEVLKWNTTAWVCSAMSGGITNSAGANVVMKSDGTNAVASSITDNATTVAVNTNKVTITEASGNTAIAGTLQVDGNVTAGNSSTILTTARGQFWARGDSGGLSAGDAAGVAIKYTAANNGEIFAYNYATSAARPLILQSAGGSTTVSGDSTIGTATTNIATINGRATIADTATSQTASRKLFDFSKTGSFDTTAGVLDSHGVYSSNTSTRSAGANALTNYALYGNASGAQTNYALLTDAGEVKLNAVSGGTNIVGALTTGSTVDVGTTLTVKGNTQLGDSASDSITFANGPAGVNLYAGKHLEWTEEFLAPQATTGIWTVGNTGAGTACSQTATSAAFARPGVVECATGTTNTGRAGIQTALTVSDFSAGSWAAAATVGFTTLSTVTEEYAALVGFGDTITAVNQTDGCWFYYDRLPVATAPGTGTISATTDKFQCWCASNSTRTGYTMDGAIVSDESFTTVNSPVAALTYPSTNMYRLKIVMTGTTRAEFFIDSGSGFTKRCDINTNVPPSAARGTSPLLNIVKSAGTTSRLLSIDQVTVSDDLNAVRSP